MRRRCKILPVDLSQCVHHESAVCFLKWPKHHVLQKRCFSKELLHTHATENATSVDPSLKLTSCVSQNLGVDLRDRKASRKAWSEGVVGRRGGKAWPKGVAERRGRKAWPKGVAERRGRKACSWFRVTFLESCSPVMC